MKIAIVRLSALGDIFQSMIVLQFIKKKFRNAQIDWIVDESFQDVLKDNLHINEIIPIPVKKIKKTKSLRDLFQVIKKLRQLASYDYVFDLQGLIKSSLVARVIPSKNRIGFDKNSIREKLASFFYTKKYFFPYHENVIKRYCFLLNQALELNINDDDILCKESFFNIKKTIKKDSLVVLVLGASFESKIYPIEKYLLIVKAIDANFIPIWKSDSERIMAQQLAKKSENIIVPENLSIRELKELISTASLVIGGDTGPTHLAWAMNIPSVTLFGCTPMERNCYQTNQNFAFKGSSKVNPYKIDKNDFSINEIDPDEIIKLIEEKIKLKKFLKTHK